MDEYLERARRVEAARLKAIRDVTHTRQHLLDVRADAVRQLADLKRTTDEQMDLGQTRSPMPNARTSSTTPQP